MKEYGYCRVSTPKQSIERQEQNIRASYPSAQISKEAFTGTKLQGRRELEKILKKVQPGDTIIFDEVSRMSRNAEEGFRLYQELFDKGVNLVFLKEPHVNTSVYREALERQISVTVQTGDNATDNFINAIMEALKQFQMDLAAKQVQIAFDQAQKERDDLSQRTKEGMAASKNKAGIEKGTKLTTKKSKAAKEVIRKHSKQFEGTLKDADVMKLAGISKNTYYKYKNELKIEYLKAFHDYKIVVYFENGMIREYDEIYTETTLEERIAYFEECLKKGTKLNVCRPDGSSIVKIEAYSHDVLIKTIKTIEKSE